MPHQRPKLAALSTPLTANFPSDALLSAATVRTPLSACVKSPFSPAGFPSAGLPSAPLDYPPTPSMASIKQEEKTPITPPLAYMDFLKSLNMSSPIMMNPPMTAPLASKTPLNRTSTASSNTSTSTADSEKSVEDAEQVDLDSAPTTGSSDATDCSCECERVHKKSKPANISILGVPLSLGSYPLSAPATGPTSFPSLRVPASPAVSHADSPVMSPFSARSIKSPFDWDAALKARRFADAKAKAAVTSGSGSGSGSGTIAIGVAGTGAGAGGVTHSSRCEKSRTSIRRIKEVVTRTVIYTPRMDPAPKGKRRRVE